MAKDSTQRIKISELGTMTRKNLSPGDLFLVSDQDDGKGGKYVSKKITYKELNGAVAGSAVKQATAEVANHASTYVPIQEWHDAGQPLSARPDLRDMADFDGMVLDCGGAES